MPRKKASKRSYKRQATKQGTKKISLNTRAGVLSEARQSEKQWIKMPAQLAKVLKKAISAEKKRESKLTKFVAKQEKLAKKTELRFISLLNGKNTPTTKRKLARAKKLMEQAEKTCNKSQQQLQAISDTLISLAAEQAKFVSLDQYISQFDIDWNKPKTLKTRRKLKSVKPETAISPEEAFDQAGFDEVTELAS